MPRPSRRDDLIDAAMKLFQRRGFHATGIDRVLDRAGAAKMTLYNHFGSKEELVLAALRRRDELFRASFAREVERRAETARGRLLAIFDVLEQWVASDEFCGCMFIAAASEYNDNDNPIRDVCDEHKHMVRAYVRGLCESAGAPDPDALACRLCVLMDGAMVTTHAARCPHAARQARAMAELVIDDALGDDDAR